MKRKNSSSEIVTKNFLEKTVEALTQTVDGNARKYRDQILTKLDGVMGELQTLRDENTIGTHQINELKGEIDDHEKRIKKLEIS